MARSRFDNLEEEQQERILREAGEEFADKGYERASLNAIIERAGISKGSLYYYFENKEDLFSTVIDRATSELLSRVVGFSLEDLTAENFWDELERLLKDVASYTSGNRWYIRLARTFYRIRDSEPGTVRDSAMFEQWRSWTRRVIERGQEFGVVRTDVSREFLVELCMSVGEACDRWVLEHFEEYDEIDFEREAERQIDAFRRLLEPREEL